MRPRAAALALLLLALPLAGCAAPEPLVRARPGDFVVLDWVARDGEGREVENVTGARAVLAAQVPARLPEGWGANNTRTVPPGLVAALDRALPGDAVETGLLPPEEAYGAWSEARTIRAPRAEDLPREVRLAPEALLPGEPPRARWANHTWDVEVLDRDGGDVRARLGAGPAEGALLELPTYWNAHYRLWRSRLAAPDDDHLRVEHLPVAGHADDVGGVRYVVQAPGGEAVADGNHPLAGQALRFHATLRAIAFPGSAGHPVAPDAVLVAAEGRRFNLSDFRGQPVLLDFFASWCVTCKQQAPILARAAEHFGANLTIVSVTIDPTDTADRIAAFRADARQASLRTWGRALDANWTFAFDPAGEAARGFSVTGIPREVLVDADGRIRATSVGLHPWPELRDDVARVLAAG